MEINVVISYEPTNNIYITIGDTKKMLLSDDKKEIFASEILQILDYKKDKKYNLIPLGEDIEKLDTNNKSYVKQIYEMINTIIKGINNRLEK